MGKDVILDLLYPRRCPLCGEILPYGEGRVCRECLGKLKRIEEPRCMKCGRTVEQEEEEYCQDCAGIPKSYRRGFPVFYYREPLKKALYDFKYKNQREYGVFFADCIWGQYQEELKRLGLDGIVPVPLHRHKRRQRGYNQAEILAIQLGKKLQVPVFPHYLRRVIDTSPQKELNDKERMHNLKNAFAAGDHKEKLETILLVDDIYTTGATVEACTNVLHKMGVKDVYYTSVAIGEGY